MSAELEHGAIRGMDEALYRMRHSAAHMMAKAVLDMFPDARIAIGPPIENGFYYDFDLPRPLTPDDLAVLEANMREQMRQDLPFVASEISKAEADERFKDQPFKLEIIEGIADEQVGLFTHDSFTDLCAGPHVASTGKVGAFRLMSVAGAYWRGDAARPMLQRVYGVCFPTQAELDAHLAVLEEARKRDHRRLGRELGLFTFSEDVGSGIPLFLPHGEIVRHEMESFVREVQTRHGFQHVWTAHVARAELFRKSGHLEHYREVMWPPMDDDGDIYMLKPMNCPSHMTLYNTQLHSYRELPLRYAEFATLYRYELAGVLSGLTRVRSLTQDDCHIFCTPEQIQEEFARCLAVVREVMAAFGLTDNYVQLSLRDRSGGKFIQDDERWQQAEAALRRALDSGGIAYQPVEGEAAFYGPKADFMARDALGREWQLSTIQVDFIQPARLGCKYIGEDGAEHTPVMLHRAVMGSTERFLGVLIEHTAGNFPTWLAPVQSQIIPIADRHLEYARALQQRLRDAGVRADVDDRSERMNAKIRHAQMLKIPYMLVVGDKEIQAEAAAVRLRSGEDLGPLPVSEIIARLRGEITSRRV
ncbi:MAG TPA: threonine--tRNA ligase [Dehalococcoidia bacterium]|nr:threonine--tRNA ligase [Dehalococcoidia bacterium]